MLQLKEAQLTAFGKFHDTKIVFAEGLQIFYGANEAGKSTLQLFIRAMLYGVPNQRKTATMLLRDRERMIPWGDKCAEGVLKLELDGKQMEIYRRLGKTPAGDKTELRDTITGELVAGYDTDTLGEQLLGISAEVFEKTFWVRQDTAFPIGTDEELAQRLRNLEESGEEEVSAEETLEKLRQAKKALQAKDKRSTPGLLDILYQKKEEKSKERFMLASEREQRKSVELRRKAAEKRLADAQKATEELQALEEKKALLQAGAAQAAKWKEVNRLHTLIEQAKESPAYLRFASLTGEMLNQAESAKRQIETLDLSQEIGYDKEEITSVRKNKNQQKQTGMYCMLLGGAVLLVALILGVMRISFWMGSLVFGVLLSTVLFAVGVFLRQKAVKALSALHTRQTELEKREAQLLSNLSAYKKEFSGILTAFGCETLQELQAGFADCQKAKLEAESYQKAYETLLEGENPDQLKQAFQEMNRLQSEDEQLISRDIAGELRELQQIQMQAVGEIKELEGKLSYVYHEGKSPADVETEILLLDEEIAAGQERLSALELAESVFASVLEERKTEFAPKVNTRVTGFLTTLSSGKYQDVRVSDTYRMRIGTAGGDTAEAEYFSRGTYEQIYLSLRLALGELIGSGDEPMFLDDILASYDDTRAYHAVQLLQQLGKERQILLFTCHKSVKKFGEELSVKIHDLEEEITDGSRNEK